MVEQWFTSSVLSPFFSHSSCGPPNNERSRLKLDHTDPELKRAFSELLKTFGAPLTKKSSSGKILKPLLLTLVVRDAFPGDMSFFPSLP